MDGKRFYFKESEMWLKCGWGDYIMLSNSKPKQALRDFKCRKLGHENLGPKIDLMSQILF